MDGVRIGCLDVIMPAYNAADTIAESVRSALAFPLCRRVFVVDDASRDDTAAIVEALAVQAADRVVLTRLTRNGGPAYARNIGLALAETGLVAFLDADDLYEERALDVAVAALHGMPDLALLRLALSPLGLDPAYRDHPLFPEAWARVTFSTPSNVVARRRSIVDAGGFPENDLFRRQGGEDVALFKAITRTCRTGTLFTQPGVLYRIRPDCAALRLLRAYLEPKPSPEIEADLPRAEAITERIMQRLQILSPLAVQEPAVVEVLITWSQAGAD
ncbi:glycosyltransferase family 2 protein [Methylobacterium sp. SD21]|uniref:glycosyltransferase family 2 protein n=1 Tax=Methylobacterium litchii TaxID=3138810 RepID=UPI00313EA438